MSLASALESAAEALPQAEAVIRPANGDPVRVLDGLEAEVASEVLIWLLEHDAAAGEELVSAWADREEGVALLAALDPSAFSKGVRKVLRRARHRLRSRGVTVAEPVREVVATLPEIEDNLGGAYLSFPDPNGAQMAVRVEPKGGGGTRILQAVFNFEHGVLEFRSHDANRSAGRKLLRELSLASRSGFAAISPAAWATVLEQASEAQVAERPLPIGYAETRGRWETDPAGLTEVYTEIARAEGGPTESNAHREAVEWVIEGRIGPWPPERAALEAGGEKVRQALQSQLLVDDAQRRRQVDSVVGDIATERFAGPAGERTARRFESIAYIFWRTEKKEEAAVCIATAKAFRELSPEQNPVARALTGRSLEPLLREWQEEEAASLLARP